MAAHAIYSASAAHRWIDCPGSVALAGDAPSATSAYAREGVAAHRVLTLALSPDAPPVVELVGNLLDVDGADVLIDDDMIRHATTVEAWIRQREAELGGAVLVDRRTQYHDALEVAFGEGWGTLDVSIVAPGHLVVIDYKYGRGVEVHAHDPDTGKPNPQLALYALGELAEHGDMAEFARVDLVIWQPRVSDEPSVYRTTPEALRAWARENARSAAQSVRNALTTYADYRSGIVPAADWETAFLNPGEKQCRFCPAKGTCPALRAEAAIAVVDWRPATPAEFADVAVPGKDHLAPATDEWLDAVFPKLELIDGWVSAVRAEIERRLLAGRQFKNCKLVAGRRGARAWADPAAAEAELKSFRLKIEDMYDLKLISPTTAEKRVEAGVIGPRQWKKLQALVTQSDGKLGVAPIGDKRPAISVGATALEFEPAASTEEDMT